MLQHSVNSVVSADKGTDSCNFLFVSRLFRLQARKMAGWPSGLRRQFKALVFGRGFESHFSHSYFFSVGYIFSSVPAVSQRMKEKGNC